MAKCDKDGKLPTKIEPTTEQARWHFRRKQYNSNDVSEYIKQLKEVAVACQWVPCYKPEEHLRLKNALSSIKGKFVLSYNDCPEVRECNEN